MRVDLMAAITKAREIPTPTGSGVEFVSFAVISAAAVAWGAKFITGRLKQDAIEKLELAAAVKKSDAALDTLFDEVAELKIGLVKCETHREHDAAERARIIADAQESRARDASERARLTAEIEAIKAAQKEQKGQQS